MTCSKRSAREQVEDAIRVGLGYRGFETLGDPLAGFAGGDVHELGADGGAVKTAGIGDKFVVEVELRDR